MDASDVINTIIDDWKASDINEIKALVGADYHVHDLPPLNLDLVLDEVPEEVREGRMEGLVSSYKGWRCIDHEEMARWEIIDDGERMRKGRLGRGSSISRPARHLEFNSYNH
jgi:hypothetical protein